MLGGGGGGEKKQPQNPTPFFVCFFFFFLGFRYNGPRGVFFFFWGGGATGNRDNLMEGFDGFPAIFNGFLVISEGPNDQ